LTKVTPISGFRPPDISGYRQLGFAGSGEWTRTYFYMSESSAAIYACKFLDPSPVARKQMLERGWTENDIWQRECLGGNTRTLPGLAYGSLEQAVDGTTYYREEPLDGFLSDLPYETTVLTKNKKKTERVPSTKHIIHIAKSLASGLHSLHQELDRIHGDLHPDNIGYTSHGDIKITDFGASTIGSQDRKYGGNILVRAPERFLCDELRPASDVWSYGSNLYRLFTGKFFLEDELQHAAEPAEIVRALSLSPGSWNAFVNHKVRHRSIPKAFQGHLARCLYEESSRIPHGGKLQDDVAKTVIRYERSLPRSHVKRAAVWLTALGMLGTAALTYTHLHTQQQSLEEKLSSEQRGRVFQEKQAIVRLFQQGRYYSDDLTELIGLAQLESLRTLLDDKSTAIAAFLDEKKTYGAIASTGTTKSDKVMPFLREADPDFYGVLVPLVAPAGDSWFWQGAHQARLDLFSDFKERFPSFYQERINMMVTELQQLRPKDAETRQRILTLHQTLRDLTGLGNNELDARIADSSFKF